MKAGDTIRFLREPVGAGPGIAGQLALVEKVTPEMVRLRMEDGTVRQLYRWTPSISAIDVVVQHSRPVPDLETSRRCPQCKGKGTEEGQRRNRYNPDARDDVEFVCSGCEGSGRVDEDTYEHLCRLLGLCIACGEEEPRPGAPMCPECSADEHADALFHADR